MDDFQRAAAAAQGRYTHEEWAALPQREQARAIYTALRHIDAERAATAPVVPRRRPTSRSAASASIEMNVVAHAD
jgi:hypothetical protein